MRRKVFGTCISLTLSCGPAIASETWTCLGDSGQRSEWTIAEGFLIPKGGKEAFKIIMDQHETIVAYRRFGEGIGASAVFYILQRNSGHFVQLAAMPAVGINNDPGIYQMMCAKRSEP
jgi:hypothetical protein